MARKTAIVLVVTVLGFTLNGCGPCGFFWDDWRSPGTCRGNAPAPK